MERSKPQKRILFITVRSDQGGGPKHLKDLAQELKIIDSTIQLFFASPLTPPFGDFFQNAGVKHIKIPSRKFSLKSFVQIYKLLKEFKISNVHSHGRGAGVYSRILKIFSPKLNVIHTFHGIHQEPGILGFIKLWLDRGLSYLTNSFIFVSNDEKDDGLSKKIAISRNSHVIHNGDPAFRLLSTPNSPPPFKFATIARLHYQKGLDLGIELLSRFKIENPDIQWEWHIAGPGEDKEKHQLVERLENGPIKDRVHFWGNQDPTHFLQNKHLYLSFSRWEGLPLAPIEAFIMGVPCLLSDVIGHGDIADNLSPVITFDLNQYESFERKIVQIINLYPQHLNSTRSFQNQAINKFSLREMSLKTILLYT